MNVQHKLTTARLMLTARMRMVHSSVHARKDLQEMGKHAMVGSFVHCILTYVIDRYSVVTNLDRNFKTLTPLEHSFVLVEVVTVGCSYRNGM